MTDAVFGLAPAIAFLLIFVLEFLFGNRILLDVLIDGMLHQNHVGHAFDVILDGLLLVEAFLLRVLAHHLVLDDHLAHLILNLRIRNGGMRIGIIRDGFRCNGLLLSLGHEVAIDREVLEFSHGGAGGDDESKRGGNGGLHHFL